jgi:TonB family protein
MTDQRRHSVKNLQEFIDQMSRRRSAQTPPALSEDPWGDDSVVAATSELPRPDSVPAGSAVNAEAEHEHDDDDNATNRSRDSNRGSRPSAAPTNAHARAAASLGRGTLAPPPAHPSSDPASDASSDAFSDASSDVSIDSIDALVDAVLDAGATTPLPIVETPPPEPVAPPERTSQRRIAVNAPTTDRVGRPPLRDSGRRIEKDGTKRPSEQRIATERPEEREPLRWPVIILSALVAGGVIILTAIKAKEYTERTDSTTYVATPPAEPAASVATADPTTAPGATEPIAAPPEPPAAAPVAPTPAGPAAPAPSPAAPVTAVAAPSPTPPPIASSPEPAAPSELPSRAIAHIEMPADPDNGAADKTPKAVDKAIKPRPHPPARVVRAVPARPRPDPDPPPRSERSDSRSSESKPEVARAEPAEPKAKPAEPAPAEPPAARAEASSGPRPGTIDVAATRAAARTQIGPVLQCYERARMDDPSLSGTVQARITIGPDGTVSRVDIASSTLGAPTVESCIRQAIARWRLPRPSGGVAAALTYPLVFQ